MAELVDAKDLKSFGIYSRPGSSPGEATKCIDNFYECYYIYFGYSHIL